MKVALFRSTVELLIFPGGRRRTRWAALVDHVPEDGSGTKIFLDAVNHLFDWRYQGAIVADAAIPGIEADSRIQRITPLFDTRPQLASWLGLSASTLPAAVVNRFLADGIDLADLPPSATRREVFLRYLRITGAGNALYKRRRPALIAFLRGTQTLEEAPAVADELSAEVTALSDSRVTVNLSDRPRDILGRLASIGLFPDREDLLGEI